MNAGRRPDARVWLALVLIASSCVSTRSGALPRRAYHATADVVAAAKPIVAYRTRFVGPVDGGASAFAERVVAAFAIHPVLRHANPDGTAALEIDLTLVNTRNGLVAGLSGLACGFSFGLVPAYARDELELAVDVRSGETVLRNLTYREAVTTVIHLTAAFTPAAAQPRRVVEEIVDDMLMHVLHDLDATGLLRTGTVVQGLVDDGNVQTGASGPGAGE